MVMSKAASSKLQDTPKLCVKRKRDTSYSMMLVMFKTTVKEERILLSLELMLLKDKMDAQLSKITTSLDFSPETILKRTTLRTLLLTFSLRKLLNGSMLCELT